MDKASPTIESAYKLDTETARALFRALILTFIPHDYNSDTRKHTTIILFVTWSGITALRYLGFGTSGDEQIYWVMTVTVFSIVFHLWGFEYGVLSASMNVPERLDIDPDDDEETK